MVLPIGEFWKSGAGNKRLWRCRLCAKEYQKNWRKVYKDTNVIKNRIRSARWRAKNKLVYTTRIKTWRAKNKLKLAELHSRRRARQKGNGVCRVSAKDLLSMLRRQQGECYLCGRPMKNPNVDHIIPIDKGGRHAIGNLAWACRECNRNKRNVLLVEIRYGRSRIYTSINPSTQWNPFDERLCTLRLKPRCTHMGVAVV